MGKSYINIWYQIRNSLIFSLLIALSSLFVISAVFDNSNAYAGIMIGDLLVVEQSANANPLGVVFRVDQFTGNRVLVTDFANPAQGPLGDEPRDLTMEPDGNICVIDSDAGTDDIGSILHVNVADGMRTLISDLGNPLQGPIGDLPQGISMINGNLYFVDRDAPSGNGGLYLVDKNTGVRTVISDLANPGQGPLGDSARDLAAAPGGGIYVVTDSGGTDNNGLLFEVNPATGFRTLLSDFGDLGQGPTADPRWIVAPPTGNLVYVVNPSNVNNALFEVDTTTGNREIISDFDDPAQGPTDSNNQGLAMDNRGNFFVNGNVTDVLFSIDPNGTRSILSEYDNPAQGPVGSFSQGIIIATVRTDISGISVPTLSEWGLIAMASILGIAGFMIIRRKRIIA